MPSIPQSLLWISLVVLWLFVLVPMLISKRDAVRRTSDVALATRVLNGGSASRRLRRSRPAAGHRSDPDWRPAAEEYVAFDEDLVHTESADSSNYVAAPRRAARPARPARSVMVVAPLAEDVTSEYLDVDIVEEDSGALPVGGLLTDAAAPSDLMDEDTVGQLLLDEVLPEAAPVADSPVSESLVFESLVDEAVTDEDAIDEDVAGDWPGHGPQGEAEDDGSASEYEYVDDTSGLELPEDAEVRSAESLNAARRRRYESKTAEAVSARKYKFRRRMLTVQGAVLVGSAAAAFTVAPAMWWFCGSAGVITLLYLAYLRRQTAIEARLRQRRMQRMARSRLGVENTDDREFDVVPSRLRRPGAVVLDIDDEDPIFEHLDHPSAAHEYDLPRASGQ